MIKINLLTEVKQAQRKKGKAGGGEAGFNVNNALILGCLALAMVYCGLMYFKISGRKALLEGQILEAQKEQSRLQKILEEVAKFEKKKANLQKKIELINDLKRNQKGPVRIMDEVSRMVPDLLWLDTLDVKLDALTVKGRALNLNAIANFIDNVKGNQYFSEPNLQDISQTVGPSYEFQLTFTFQLPDAKKPVEAPAAKPAPKPAPPKKPAQDKGE